MAGARTGADGALPAPAQGAHACPGAARSGFRLLTPLDLAVSKLSRFSEQDQDDIRALARAGLIEPDALRRRAEAALPDYVGNLDRIRNSISLACDLVARDKK